MAALNAKNERDLRDEIDKLKATTIEFQAVVIELLRWRNAGKEPQCEAQTPRQTQVPQVVCAAVKSRLNARPSLPSALNFKGTELSILDHHGKPWLTATDLGKALGYAASKGGAKLTPPLSLSSRNIYAAYTNATPMSSRTK